MAKSQRNGSKKQWNTWKIDTFTEAKPWTKLGSMSLFSFWPRRKSASVLGHRQQVRWTARAADLRAFVSQEAHIAHCLSRLFYNNELISHVSVSNRLADAVWNKFMSVFQPRCAGRHSVFLDIAPLRDSWRKLQNQSRTHFGCKVHFSGSESVRSLGFGHWNFYALFRATADLKPACVGISRAKIGLIILGNMDMHSTVRLLRGLREYKLDWDWLWYWRSYWILHYDLLYFFSLWSTSCTAHPHVEHPLLYRVDCRI